MKRIILSALLASTVAMTAFAGVAGGVLDGGDGDGVVAGAGSLASAGDDPDGSTNSFGVKNSASAR